MVSVIMCPYCLALPSMERRRRRRKSLFLNMMINDGLDVLSTNEDFSIEAVLREPPEFRYSAQDINIYGHGTPP
jgi:hypothetical protein